LFSVNGRLEMIQDGLPSISNGKRAVTSGGTSKCSA